MRLVTADFESYYDQDYSLSKLTTEEYVRSPLFEAIMVGLKVDAGPTYTVVGGDIRYALRELELEKCAVLCHHAHFDGLILNHHYGIRPKIWFDTIPMARAEIGSVAAKGMSLGSLRQYFGMADKGTEVLDAKGKHLADFTAEELAEYRRYCGEDVDGTYEIFQHLWRKFSLAELQLMDMTTRLFTEPVLHLDTALLSEYKERIIAEKAYLLLKAGVDKSELVSNNKFAELLRRHGIEPPMKTSLRTGKQTYAFAKTDTGMKELLEHSDEFIVALAEARVGTKTSIAETRAQRFVDISSRGPTPVYIKYWGAEQTGRPSAGDKSNFLNLGRNAKLDPELGHYETGQTVITPKGRAEVVEYDGLGTLVTSLGQFRPKHCHRLGLRDTVSAPPGYKIVVGDSSNIEARKLCWLAAQEDVLETYRNGGDPYRDMGAYVFKRPVGKEDPGRQLGKVLVLAAGFGMGGNKFHETATKAPWSLDIDKQLAFAGIDAFRAKYYRVKALWDYFGFQVIPAMASGKRIYADAKNTIVTGKETLELPNGRVLRYPNLRKEMQYDIDPVTSEKTPTGEQWVFDIREGPRILQAKLYGGKGVENMTQALARVVVMDQILTVSKRYRVVLPPYDEVVCCVPDSEAEECEQYIKLVFSTPPIWAPDLPVACETGIGQFYGGAKG